MADKQATARAANSTTTITTTTTPTTRKRGGNSVGEVVDFVKVYVRQETLGPLKGAGRWLAFGAVGALALAISVAFFVLGLLRMVQHEFARTFHGRWMGLLPYLFALVTCTVVIGLAVSRINKKTLQKDSE